MYISAILKILPNLQNLGGKGGDGYESMRTLPPALGRLDFNGARGRFDTFSRSLPRVLMVFLGKGSLEKFSSGDEMR